MSATTTERGRTILTRVAGIVLTATATATAMTMTAALAPAAAAQEVELGGQVRPRIEVRNPVAGATEAFTSMRTRAQLRARLAPDVRAFVQLQDVRLWGEETSSLGDFSADGLDLHQGWVELGDRTGAFRAARIGRQEVALGGERLVGAVGWTPQARAFDGLRVTTGGQTVRLELLAFQTAEGAAASVQEDGELAGAYGVWTVSEGRTLDLYGLFDRREAEVDTREATFGARYAASEGAWSYRVESSVQTGTRSGNDVAAWMAGVRAGRTFAAGRARLTLWYDYLSGDDDPGDGETGVFNTLYATNHKFYGFSDLFLDIPVHTGGRGLRDAAVKLAVTPRDGVRIGADLHSFRVAASGGGVDPRLGEELDLTLAWDYAPGVTLQGGVSYVLQGDGLADLERLGEDMVFSYLMLSAVF